MYWGVHRDNTGRIISIEIGISDLLTSDVSSKNISDCSSVKEGGLDIAGKLTSDIEERDLGPPAVARFEDIDLDIW